MEAVIITIGDELIYGHTIDTNSRFIALRLSGMGIRTRRIVSIGDTEEEILDALRDAWQRVQIIIVTGGLGITHDDITRSVISRFRADFPGTGLIESAIDNEIGSAQGILLRLEDKCLSVLPGVPFEMKTMFERGVEPLLRQIVPAFFIRHKFLRTASVRESDLYHMLDNLPRITGLGSLAFLPGPEGVSLRITVQSDSEIDARDKLHRAVELIRGKIGPHIFGEDDETLAQVVGAMLKQRGLKIAVAESCTGGLIASRLTDVPGSSDYFERGLVVYGNQSKSDLLGVPPSHIAGFGAVSPEVAVDMAVGIRNISGADVGLSTTGIAGPAGGSPGKPVGLVYIGLADRHGTEVHRQLFTRDRLTNKSRFAQGALDRVRKRLVFLDQPSARDGFDR
ncbi:nicotinamide-nucleotide amidohydrolase family protein [bacterium]|nr:nicotinamide-nucleotide amidohydrolase family protein [candidate division CSSED10-310 bacterium]